VGGGGIGYGVARYMGGGEAAERLRGAGEAELSFNYLGQFDGTLGEGGEWGVGSEWAGEAHSGRGEREHVLGVTASVVGGMLHVSVGYSRREYAEWEVEGLAGRYVEALEELIEKRAEGGGLTPSDFPLAQIEQAQLDEALGEVEFE
jgi:microcystin synthetase protein McyA